MSLQTQLHTLYGPGEIETYKHTLLQQSVKDAKLKVWYPGRWQQNSPNAFFRTSIVITNNKDDGDQERRNDDVDDESTLLRFRSNARIISAQWIADKPDDCPSNYYPTLDDNQKSNDDAKHTIHHEQQTHQTTSTIKSKEICYKSSMQTIHNERVYDHVILQSPNEGNRGESINDYDRNVTRPGYLVLELDTRSISNSRDRVTATSSSSSVVQQKGDEEIKVQTELYPPPCITLQSSVSQQQKWEWKKDEDGEWISITTCWNYSGTTNTQKEQIICRDVQKCNLTQTAMPSIEEWKFPHQIDLCQVSTVHPLNKLSNKGCANIAENDDELIYDFGKELLGKIHITIPSSLDAIIPPVKLRIGETLAEAVNDDEGSFEQCTDLNYEPSSTREHTWTSCHLVAFRYVRLILPHNHHSGINVSCQVHSPILNKECGAFTSSDNEIDNKIWNTAAYTLQLCIHENFIVDGVKRDRLPWVGDLAVSLLANAYSLSDGQCIRWTLTVLGRCGMDVLNDSVESSTLDSHINGMIDYTLWYIVTHWLYQRYYDDFHFLGQEWRIIEQRLRFLIRRCCDDNSGWFVINEEGDSDRIFIDWTTDCEKTSAVQILWWYALNCGIILAEKVANLNVNEEDDENRAILNFISLMKATQSKLENSYLDNIEDIQLGFSRHSHILAIVSGLYKRLDDRAREGEWYNPDFSNKRWQVVCQCMGLYDRSRKALMGDVLPQVATPYMKTLEILAISKLGERTSALESVRSYWGGMLDSNATTFYEAFNESETLEDIPKFYSRGFGRSLCHAWAAGPCALYPELMLGLRPLSDGWKEWACDPLRCCASSSVSATIQTQYGIIEVELCTDSFKVSVPKDTSMEVMGKRYGCGRHTFACKSSISSQDVHQYSKKYRGWQHHPSHVISPHVNIPGHEGIQMVDVPTVYQLPAGYDLFYMTFVGFDGIGYQSFVAESIDLLHWSNYRLALGYGEEGSFDFGGSVLGAYLYESYDIDAPRILKKLNGKFYSLYGAYSRKGGYEIDPGSQGLASSKDGLVWKREKDESILSIFGPGTVKDWEKSSIYQPWLLEHDEVYYNFYNAKEMPQWIEQIGLATSNDLHSWIRHADNPVLQVSKRTEGTMNDGFDTQFAADAKVFWDSDEKHWVMFYFGVGKGGAHIMVAYSKDLIQWVRDPIPLYTAGSNPSGLDKRYAHKISLIFHNGKWCMFYCAVGDTGRGIGLISSQQE